MIHYRRVAVVAWLALGILPTVTLVTMTIWGARAAAYYAVASIPLLLWRSGVSIDPVSRTVREWNGPLFPLFKIESPLDEYAIVSVMEDSVEVFDRSGSVLVTERQYASNLGLKLQPRLSPGMQYPDDLPPALNLASYSKRRVDVALKNGRELAQLLGFEFRADV